MKEKPKNKSTIKRYKTMQAYISLLCIPFLPTVFISSLVCVATWITQGSFVWTPEVVKWSIIFIGSALPIFLIYSITMEYLQPMIDELEKEQDTITLLVDNYDQIIERLAHREADEHQLHISRTELENMVDLRVKIEKAGYTFDEDMRIVRRNQ